MPKKLAEGKERKRTAVWIDSFHAAEAAVVAELYGQSAGAFVEEAIEALVMARTGNGPLREVLNQMRDRLIAAGKASRAALQASKGEGEGGS